MTLWSLWIRDSLFQLKSTNFLWCLPFLRFTNTRFCFPVCSSYYLVAHWLQFILQSWFRNQCMFDDNYHLHFNSFILYSQLIAGLCWAFHGLLKDTLYYPTKNFILFHIDSSYCKKIYKNIFQYFISHRRSNLSRSLHILKLIIVPPNKISHWL